MDLQEVLIQRLVQVWFLFICFLFVVLAINKHWSNYLQKYSCVLCSDLMMVNYNQRNERTPCYIIQLSFHILLVGYVYISVVSSPADIIVSVICNNMQFIIISSSCLSVIISSSFGSSLWLSGTITTSSQQLLAHYSDHSLPWPYFTAVSDNTTSVVTSNRLSSYTL